MKRRTFLKKGGTTVAAAAGAALAIGAPAVHAKKSFNWKMVTTWPPHFPVMGEGAEEFARLVEEMSEGRLRIQVYGAGELVPALQTFDAVSQGIQTTNSQTLPLLKVPEDRTRPPVTPPGSPRITGSFISSPSMRRKTSEGMADLERMLEDATCSSSGLLNTTGERRRRLSFPNFSNFNESSD